VRVRNAYGPALDQWRAARLDLPDRAGEYVFGSEFLDRCGMTSSAF
jgi:hypothetical protein